MMPYSPYYAYPQMQAPVPDMLGQFKMPYRQNGDPIFVLNETEATGYPVAPNNTVILWDKNESVLYVKSANSQGVPTMRVLDYTERSAQTAQEKVYSCGGDFARIGDLEELKAKIERLEGLVGKEEK